MLKNNTQKPNRSALWAYLNFWTFVVSCFSTMLFVATPLSADTIFLKNGSLIDGKITHRDKKSVLLQIGDIGKLEIPLEEIYLIEKNKRQGGQLLKNSLDTKGKVEFVKEGKGKKRGASGKRSKRSRSKNSRKSQPGDEEVETDIDSTDNDSVDEVDEDETLVEPPILGEEEEKISPKLKKRIEDLIIDLDHKKRKNRVRAERHLKAIGRPAVPFLIPLVKSDRSLTRVAVLRLFFAFGDERVIEPCIDSMLDINEYARSYANKTLIRITGEDFSFNADANPRRRELAQKKWAKWWEEEKESLEETRRTSQRNSD